MPICSPGTNGVNSWDMSSDVRTWLESPDGEKWSRNRHRPIWSLVTVKDDSSPDVDTTGYLWYAALQ